MVPAQAEPAVPSLEASSSTEEAVQTPSETPAPSGEDRAARGATASSEMTLTNERNTTDVVIELPEGAARTVLLESADPVALARNDELPRESYARNR